MWYLLDLDTYFHLFFVVRLSFYYKIELLLLTLSLELIVAHQLVLIQ